MSKELLMEATITTKGQITLPKSLREALHLKVGDKILFEEQEDGTYLIKPRVINVQVLKGCITTYKGSSKTLQDMERAIAENAGALF